MIATTASILALALSGASTAPLPCDRGVSAIAVGVAGTPTGSLKGRIGCEYGAALESRAAAKGYPRVVRLVDGTWRRSGSVVVGALRATVYSNGSARAAFVSPVKGAR
jgi:hypothetical protein